MTRPADIAHWRPCWYCGLPLDDLEETVCAEHGPIDQVPTVDPDRPNLLPGMAADAITDLSAYLADELPELAAGQARLWAVDHGFTPQEAGDYAGRAAGLARTAAEHLIGRQTRVLVEERRQRQHLAHVRLIALARGRAA